MKYSTTAFILFFGVLFITMFLIAPFVINHVPGIVSSYILVVGGFVVIVLLVFMVIRWMAKHLE